MRQKDKMMQVTTKNHFGIHSIEILFAYVRTNGNKTGDKDIRLVLKESRPDTWTHTAFLKPKSADDSVSPYEYGDQFNSDTPLLKWMLTEREAGRLLEGNTYTFKSKSITLLMPDEIQDIVNRGLVYTKGHYETRPY